MAEWESIALMCEPGPGFNPQQPRRKGVKRRKEWRERG